MSANAGAITSFQPARCLVAVRPYRCAKKFRNISKQGKSQKQIVDAFVAKYGQNILQRHRRKGDLAAWVTPFAVLSCGLILVFFVIKAWTQRKPTAGSVRQRRLRIPDAYRDRLEKELKDLG